MKKGREGKTVGCYFNRYLSFEYFKMYHHYCVHIGAQATVPMWRSETTRGAQFSPSSCWFHQVGLAGCNSLCRPLPPECWD